MQLILHLTICRGDTISDSCKRAGHKFKLDLRLVMTQNNEHAVDGQESNSKKDIQRQA